MEYMCAHCRRPFSFEDFISFCPYCGWNLKGKAADHEAEISRTIDSIWGYGAACKSEFSDVIESCMNLIQIYARDSMEKVWPAKDLCHYEKNYAAMQKCQNRKTLLARVQGFVYALDAVIQKLSDRLPEQAMHTTGNVMAETESMVQELYDFLGVRYDPSRRLCPVEEMCRAEVVYTREQLQVLYHLVLKAYEKYRRCVEDNNMFAAFASTSSYGVLPSAWRRWINGLGDSDDEEEEKKEEPAYREVLTYMKEHNAQAYTGMLDEDFVPHVDAFWYGLERLCTFIDHHVVVTWKKTYTGLSEEECGKLRRAIASRQFAVSESRLEDAFHLQKRFEKKVESLKKAPDNKMTP